VKRYDPLDSALTHYLFFTGKGGVGKTTIASATAIKLADEGARVMLVSTDPASNLQDVFQTSLTDQPRAIPGVANLQVANFNPMAAAKAYRESVVAPYRGVLPAAALANMQEQLSGSCTTEVAAFNEFTHFLTDETVDQSFDYIIFDTAPTGHTLRMLQLPAAWTSYLDTNVTGTSCLGQLAGLADNRQIYRQAVATLADGQKTTMLLVTRPQRTSLLETVRTASELNRLGMTQQKVIVNGVIPVADDEVTAQIRRQQQQDLAELLPRLAASPQSEVYLRAGSTVGIANVRQILEPETVEPHQQLRQPTPQLPTLATIIADLDRQDKRLIFTMGKGGVGKTATAVQIAQGLVARGKSVQLITTDPADHLGLFKVDARVQVTHVDQQHVLQDYQDQVIQQAAQTMSADDLDYVKEDLRSPCTQEVALFRVFADEIAQTKCEVTVVDTAPTGHTLLLLNTTREYEAEVRRTVGTVPVAVTDLLARLRHAQDVEVVMVTLPEATPVYETERLSADLNRAQMPHKWWLINESLLATTTTSPLLQAKATAEKKWVAKVEAVSGGHFAVEGWQPDFEAQRLRV
jgi:arsenite-transporting ATPase